MRAGDNKQDGAGLTLAQVAAARQVTLEELQDVGYRDTKWNGLPAVALDCEFPDGTTRAHIWKELGGGSRFGWAPGDGTPAYGTLKALKVLEEKKADGDRPELLVVEGGFDWCVARALGFTAVVGVPGVSMWKGTRITQALLELDVDVLVVCEDVKGLALVRAVAASLPEGRVRVISLGFTADEKVDLDDFVLSYPTRADALEAFRKRLQGAEDAAAFLSAPSECFEGVFLEGEWEDPIPLGPPAPDLLPVQALPDWLRKHVESIARHHKSSSSRNPQTASCHSARTSPCPTTSQSTAIRWTS